MPANPSPELPALAAAFLQLDPPGRRRVHVALCQNAVAMWEQYALGEAPIEYIDSVIGMQHVVDMQLPRDALVCAQAGRPDAGVDYRYSEPIVAMQDDDLAFPGHIELAYYAIYNLFRKYAQGAAIDDWLIVNQALSAEQDPSRWPGLLSDAIGRR